MSPVWLGVIAALACRFCGEVASCQTGTACPVLPYPTFGVRYGDGSCPGDSISYECDDGFTLTGSPARRCQENGQWSGTDVRCTGGGIQWQFIHQKHNPFIWPSIYPKCDGKKQSPVNVRTDNTMYDESLLALPLQLTNFNSFLSGTYLNNGVAPVVVLSVKDASNVPQMTGGPLADRTYTMLQIHLHFGSSNVVGSEHTLNGKVFAGELHMVHWNSGWYNSSSQAVSSPKGLSVLAVLLQIGDGNVEIGKLVHLVDRVKYEGWSMPLANLNVTSLLPDSTGYYTYSGSLTTPPCDETVTWIVMRQPITVSVAQLEAFRGMMRTSNSSREMESMADNYRPTQPLNGRSIYTNQFLTSPTPTSEAHSVQALPLLELQCFMFSSFLRFLIN